MVREAGAERNTVQLSSEKTPSRGLFVRFPAMNRRGLGLPGDLLPVEYGPADAAHGGREGSEPEKHRRVYFDAIKPEILRHNQQKQKSAKISKV